jgi:hypothetical protein
MLYADRNPEQVFYVDGKEESLYSFNFAYSRLSWIAATAGYGWSLSSTREPRFISLLPQGRKEPRRMATDAFRILLVEDNAGDVCHRRSGQPASPKRTCAPPATSQNQPIWRRFCKSAPY